MKGVVDRIEGEYVVLEVEDKILNFKINLFPPDIEEGDVVEEKNGQFFILKEETYIRKESIEKMFRDLLEWGGTNKKDCWQHFNYLVQYSINQIIKN